MRKAMIAVSMMLALLQFWPMIFGQRTVAEVATPSANAAVVVAVPKRVVAVANGAAPAAIKVSTLKTTAPQNCYRQYQAAYSKCAIEDRACGAKTADQWDLCEATGFWPGTAK